MESRASQVTACVRISPATDTKTWLLRSTSLSLRNWVSPICGLSWACRWAQCIPGCGESATPGMMDALVPIGSIPEETSGRNRLWRHAIVEAIRNDPEWKNGEYKQQPHIYSRIASLMTIMTGDPVKNGRYL